MQKWVIGAVTFFLLAVPATADLSVRECIIGPPSGRWEVPGDSVWRTAATLAFSNAFSSDIVAQGAATYAEGPGQMGVRMEFQLVLDGVASFTMQHRPHTGFPTSKMLRASFPGISAGQHTLELKVRSTSGFSGYLAQAWITPVLVESTESTSSGVGTGTITTPTTSTWTTLVTTTVSPPSGQSVMLGGYSTISQGP